MIKSGNTLIVSVHNKKGYDMKMISSATIILRNIVISEFEYFHNVLIIDRPNIVKESCLEKNEFKEICTKVLKTEGCVNLPPMKKKMREEINFWANSYRMLKIKTKGSHGNRQISVAHKK